MSQTEYSESYRDLWVEALSAPDAQEELADLERLVNDENYGQELRDAAKIVLERRSDGVQ